MALVAYSDDSDFATDSEDGQDGGKGVTARLSDRTQSVEYCAPAGKGGSGVDTIEDEDEDDLKSEKPSSGLFSSVPAAIPVSDLVGKGQEEEDEVVDVPTVDTWKVIKELKKQNSTPAEASQTSTHKKERKKVKILLPSLSEFADEEEDEEEMKEPPRKKLNPSNSGSGLFSLLPEPKHLSTKKAGRSLVPHVLTKQPPKPQKPKKLQRKTPETIVEDGTGCVSEEEEDETATGVDFFSLSESSTVKCVKTVRGLPDSQVPIVVPDVEPIKEETKVPPSQSRDLPIVLEQHYKKYDENPDVIPLNLSQPVEASVTESAGIDEATILRLAGKRGRAEAISFIDVNADDALLTRQEWMTKALSEEKPQHSFSKKREGLPTQKQKQKHQITYLAHQAKERELDLKNSWAQNRMTKMQSQAKYGF